MKKTIYLTLLLCLMSVSPVIAQENKDSNIPEDCKKNITYFRIHAKVSNYLDAYTFWKKAYDKCPSASKDIYVTGPKILAWKIDNAKTAEEKAAFKEELMKVYDDRIKYFGDDPKYGVDYVLASKVADYLKYNSENADYDKVYNWLKDVVAEKKQATDYMTLNYYLFASLNRMLKNDTFKEQYIKDYLMITQYYEDNIKANQGNEKTVQLYADLKNAADGQFASSGAASCEMLEKIYANKIDEHKADKEYLDMVINLMRRVNCEESPIYFKASEYAYTISPSVEAALGLAKRSILNNDYDRAFQLFQEAADLSETADEKGEIYYNMALLSFEQKRYSQVRKYANMAMNEKKNYGAPMILIANAYAATAGSIFPEDPIKSRCVYCLVVDKLQRAKSIDPSVSDDANRLISRYRPYYPAKEDVFMHPDLKEGQSITIGGWIGESTTVRTSK